MTDTGAAPRLLKRNIAFGVVTVVVSAAWATVTTLVSAREVAAVAADFVRTASDDDDGTEATAVVDAVGAVPAVESLADTALIGVFGFTGGKSS
jgi:hypothetical protein